MLLEGRQAECPNCGAPIAFRLASSHAAVCGFCRFAVVRGSEEALWFNGRVAELVPTAAPIAVGDEGNVGGKAFVVLGRTQLDHGRGPWDEWYVGFADQTWGWLARAEGRWYLTFERDPAEPPAWDALTPGTETSLSASGSVRWVVTERGGSALLSAEGELPFAFDPMQSGRYVDLEGEQHAFATLDYGDGEGQVQLFVGRELSANELTFKQTGVGPRPVEKVEVERLRCPSCGAPIPILVPSETERCGCEACGALLDFEAGALRLLKQLDPPAVRPLIALGSEGELFGQRRTVIGFMQRMLTVDGDLYTFREYLLHAEQGYSWLLEENHHWLHVVPVASSAVREHAGNAMFETRIYKRFAKAKPTVDFVIGEFYWKVEAGDTAETCDFIAPPRLLSMERSANEISWSEGEYVTPRQLERAFALKQRLPPPTGVAPAQPNPHSLRPASLVFALLTVLWFILASIYELGGKQVLVETALALPKQGTVVARAEPVLTPPFELRHGPTTIEVELASSLDNGWIEIEAALINEAGGVPRELTVLVEHYSGVSGGESWSEGSSSNSGYFGSVPAGRYSMRVTGSWAPNGPGYTDTLRPSVRVVAGERSPSCCLGTLFLLTLPWLLTLVRRINFEQRRRENENL